MNKEYRIFEINSPLCAARVLVRGARPSFAVAEAQASRRQGCIGRGNDSAVFYYCSIFKIPCSIFDIQLVLNNEYRTRNIEF